MEKLSCKVIWVVCCFLQSTTALAQQPVKRHILALYSASQQQNPKVTRIHQNVEMVLNHLGCIVEYHDIDSGVPTAATMAKYRGIISWFEGNDFPAKELFMCWLPQPIHDGKKYVHLGSLTGFQPDGEKITKEISAAFFKTLGLRCEDDLWEDNPAKIVVAEKKPDLVEFERTLENELSYYTLV